MLTGVWSGALDFGSARLRMKFVIGENGAATLFSLDQGNRPIPGKMSADRVEIEFPSVRGNFVGRVVGPAQIDGFWLQNGQDHALLLDRGESALVDGRSPHSLASEPLAELRAHLGSPTILETDRLILREVRASDADAFQRYMLPEDYWRHDPREPPTPESVAALVGRSSRSQSQKPRIDYFLAAVDKRSDEFVGEACLRVRGVASRQGTIGYGVTSSRVGQGFATEIGLGLLGLAFETLDLHRIDAQCRAENHASRRVMAKLGMREEGVFRDNLFVRGEWWSTVQSAMLSTDERSSQALERPWISR
jgi:ribosomal-protein-alanine N-acetyltransferase